MARTYNQYSSLDDLTGRRFAFLLVLGRANSVGQKPVKYTVRCDCGNEKIVHGAHLKTGHTKACGLGCAAVKLARSRQTDHPLYSRFAAMHRRCRNPNADAYPWYGGRGIKVCQGWSSFAQFLADMGEPPSLDMQIDRIDPDGDYEPANCRWVTRSENCLNRRKANAAAVANQ